MDERDFDLFQPYCESAPPLLSDEPPVVAAHASGGAVGRQWRRYEKVRRFPCGC
jgi:hypothetical protein